MFKYNLDIEIDGVISGISKIDHIYLRLALLFKSTYMPKRRFEEVAGYWQDPHSRPIELDHLINQNIFFLYRFSSNPRVRSIWKSEHE